MTEPVTPEIGMRVSVDNGDRFGRIVDIGPGFFRLHIEGYDYLWDGDAHTVDWYRCAPAPTIADPDGEARS